MTCVSWESGCLLCDSVILVPGDQPCSETQWAMGLQIHEIPVLSSIVRRPRQCSLNGWVWAIVLFLGFQVMCFAAQHNIWGDASSGRLREGSQAPWLCFSVWNADCQTNMATFLCFIFAHAQPQLILYSHIVMLTKSLCSSWLKGMPTITWVFPSLDWALQWTQSCRAVSMASSSFSPFSPSLPSFLQLAQF